MLFNRKDCLIEWDPITPAGSNVHFKDYWFQVYSSAYNSAMAAPGTGSTFEAYLSNPSFDFTFDHNKSLFGTPQAKFFVQVKGRSVYDAVSPTWAFATGVNHEPPVTPTEFIADGGFRTVQFAWSMCTAQDFSHYAVRTHEGTAAFGSWGDFDQNAMAMTLSEDRQAGESISLEVKAIDLYTQESNTVSGSAETIEVKTADSMAFRIVPSDSKGSSLSDLQKLYDGDLDTDYISYTGGGWVQYEYPVENVINASTIWINNDFNTYLSYFDENEEDWKYFAGNASHGLSGGKLVEYSTLTAAQTNYYATEKEADGKVRMPFPVFRQFEKIILNNYNGPNINLYEWKNNVFILADEIVAGRLNLSEGVIIASSATGNRGAVFNENGLALWKDGKRNLYLSASGEARFGATGESGIDIMTGGDIEIDGNALIQGSVTTKSIHVSDNLFGNDDALATGSSVELFDFQQRTTSHIGREPKHDNVITLDEDDTHFKAKANFRGAIGVFRGITNYMPNCDDWTTYNSKSAGTTVSREYVSAIEKECTKIVMSAANNYIRQSYSHDPDSETWTSSLRIYVASAMDIWIDIGDGVNLNYYKIKKYALTTGINYINLPHTFPDNVGANTMVLIRNYGGLSAYGDYADKAGGGAVQTYYLLDSQLEELHYSTPYIPTLRPEDGLGYENYNWPQVGTMEFWLRPHFKIFGPNLVARHECEETTEPMVNGETVTQTINLTSYTRDGVQKHGGSYSWKAVCDGVGQGSFMLTDALVTTDMHNFVAGKKYEFKLWWRQDNANNSGLIVYEYYSGAWNSTTHTIGTTQNSWVEKSFTHTFNASTTGVRIQFNLSSTATHCHWIDDIEINRYEQGLDKQIIQDIDSNPSNIRMKYEKDDDKFSFYITGSTIGVSLYSTAYNDDTWQDWVHLKACWDVPNDNYYFYLGGTLVDSETGIDIGTFAPNNKLEIGSLPFYASPANYQMDSVISDLLIKSELDQSHTHYDTTRPYYDTKELANFDAKVRISQKKIDLINVNIDHRDSFDRRIQIGGLGLLARDAGGNIIHDIPDAPILTDMIYGGHIIWKEKVDYIDCTTYTITSTETSKSGNTSINNIDLSSDIPSGITNIKGVLLRVQLYLNVATTKTKKGTNVLCEAEYSSIYNQTPTIPFTSLYFEHTATDADNAKLFIKKSEQFVIPITKNNGIFYITSHLHYMFFSMNAINGNFQVRAYTFLQGFIV